MLRSPLEGVVLTVKGMGASVQVKEVGKVFKFKWRHSHGLSWVFGLSLSWLHLPSEVGRALIKSRYSWHDGFLSLWCALRPCLAGGDIY